MRKKRLLKRLVLFLLITLVSLLAFELFLRWVLFRNVSILSGLRDPALYADWSSEDDFWKLYHYFGGEFRPPKNPHPLLGWVGNFSRDTLAHHRTDKVKGRRPVLLYGDSFAQGEKGAISIQKMLNTDPLFAKNHYLLNYGVGGYGLDQIFLLFKSSVDLYLNPFVILSFMTNDIDRTVVSFRIGQKPYFRIDSDRLQLSGVPIDLDPEHFLSSHPIQIKSYLYRLIVHNKRIARWTDNWLKSDTKTDLKKEITNRIIKETLKELNNRKLEFIFVIFHPLGKDTWRDAFIRELLRNNHVEFIWAKNIIKQDALINGNIGSNFLREYFLPVNRHPNSRYNRLIAERIKEYVLD